MTDNPPIRIDSETGNPDFEGWQLTEIEAGIAELDSGRGVGHDKVSEWLKSWGKPGESRAPRQRARRDG